ncbi:MAG: hypothetical protein CL933_23925 [Deltaproteobacteria bacterium]|nr:hypothetical protein [Deltaproteobacteria bacterium]
MRRLGARSRSNPPRPLDHELVRGRIVDRANFRGEHRESDALLVPVRRAFPDLLCSMWPPRAEE